MDTETRQTGRDFGALLAESVRVHGHLCAGQVLGVRMSMLGLREIGVADPRGADRKKFLVYVEMDRCATDAVQSVTGCSLGKRSMKFVDYGKMAATFANLETGRAVRVLAREDSRDAAKNLFPEMDDKYRAQLEAYKVMRESDLFDVMEVAVAPPPEDMPGRPLRRVPCDECGEFVQDMRDVAHGGRTLCRACADGAYYHAAKDAPEAFSSPTVMQNPHNASSAASEPAFSVRSKVWLEVEGEPVFGRGRRFLLDAVGKHGSINRAAQEIQISYRKAWGYIKAMEERLGVELVHRERGGRNGGGASLTDEARRFLYKYAVLEEEVRRLADEKYRELFM
jgi:formylmethanofuran dehydrogenase subunit E